MTDRVRFYTDEDVYRAVAQQLRANGWDALSAVEASRAARSDEEQLVTSQKRPVQWASRFARRAIGSARQRISQEMLDSRCRRSCRRSLSAISISNS